MLHLAFYKGKKVSVFGKLIRWWTKSPYSHVELAFDFDSSLCPDATPGTRWYSTYSSDEADGGTRGKVQWLNPDDWDLVEISHVDQCAALKWCLSNLGKKYDMPVIFGMVINPYNDRPDRYFCSEFCLRALQNGGFRQKVHTQALF